MVWTFIARLVLGLVLSAISYALSPRPKIEKTQAVDASASGTECAGLDRLPRLSDMRKQCI